MTIRKYLQIAAVVLAIPGGVVVGGCTQQQINGALLAFGTAAALVLIGVAVRTNGGEIERSDARLKTDITPVAVLPNGLTLYSFKFKSNPATTYVGVLAQDLLWSDNQKFRRAVVVAPNGYYAVKYGELGLKMFTLDQWASVSAEVCRHPEAQCHYVRMSDLHVGGIFRPAFAN